MTLKDWKKRKLFYIKSDKQVFSITKSLLGGYNIIFTGNYQSKHFKTKSQALKFAKQYMRCH
jgi:hypothetical protein